jgi:hypothetical protein
MGTIHDGCVDSQAPKRADLHESIMDLTVLSARYEKKGGNGEIDVHANRCLVTCGMPENRQMAPT